MAEIYEKFSYFFDFFQIFTISKMKTRTQIFLKMNKNNFIKLKHIYISSANYNKHKNLYWLIIFVSYNDSSLQGLWHPLNLVSDSKYLIGFLYESIILTSEMMKLVLNSMFAPYISATLSHSLAISMFSNKNKLKKFYI